MYTQLVIPFLLVDAKLGPFYDVWVLRFRMGWNIAYRFHLCHHAIVYYYLLTTCPISSGFVERRKFEVLYPHN